MVNPEKLKFHWNKFADARTKAAADEMGTKLVFEAGSKINERVRPFFDVNAWFLKNPDTLESILLEEENLAKRKATLLDIENSRK